jgi:hypothetical protein
LIDDAAGINQVAGLVENFKLPRSRCALQIEANGFLFDEQTRFGILRLSGCLRLREGSRRLRAGDEHSQQRQRRQPKFLSKTDIRIFH